jgi:hypothetical protein
MKSFLQFLFDITPVILIILVMVCLTKIADTQILILNEIQELNQRVRSVESQQVYFELKRNRF